MHTNGSSKNENDSNMSIAEMYSQSSCAWGFNVRREFIKLVCQFLKLSDMFQINA
jgi:hypothetical protein